MAIHCRARCKDNTLCQRRVTKSGRRCSLHPGMPEAGPRYPKTRQPATGRASAAARRRTPRSTALQTGGRAPRNLGPAREAARERRRQERVKEAAKFCAEVLNDGWQETVSDRASTYVTDATWQELKRKHRKRRCKILAKLASNILAGKAKLHDLVGSIAGWLMSVIGGDQIAQAFAEELASNIPLPHEAKLTATARGLQVTGVLLCLLNGDDLTRCQCFIDLALAETKTQVKKILLAALNDWTGLGAFAPKDGPITVT